MTQFLARNSAQRPWVALAGWLFFVILGLVPIGQFLGEATTTEFRVTGGAGSNQADQLLEDWLGPDPAREFVVVQSASLPVTDPAFQQKVEGLYEQIIALDVVERAAHVYLNPDLYGYLVAPFEGDEPSRTAVIELDLVGDFDEAASHVDEVIEIIEQPANDDFRVLIVGNASISHESAEFAQHDLEQGERFGIPIALVVLLVLFGAVVAALLPLIIAGGAIVLTLALVALIGQAAPQFVFITIMVTMLGLALGIDYSLIYITRFREELDKGLDKVTAVERTGATAGRTVLFSGITVIVALSGMFLVPSNYFQSLALGAIIVTFQVLVSTLTALPAILTLLGRNVDRLSIPFFRRTPPDPNAEEEDLNSGFWGRLTAVVIRFPVISILLVCVPLLAAAWFFFEMDTGVTGVETLPGDSITREAFLTLEEEFPAGFPAPVEIVIQGDINDPRTIEGLTNLFTNLLGATLPDGLAFTPWPPQAQEADLILGEGPLTDDPLAWVIAKDDLALLRVDLPGEANNEPSLRAIEQLRDEIIPASFGDAPVDVYVGGNLALAVDFHDIVDTYTPIVIAFVLGISFITLMVVFRSIIIPVKAIFMNLLAVGATYGLLVLVFQLSGGILGFSQTDRIDILLPLLLFSILFGLSMDYHVFLLSAVRERFDETGDNHEAVLYGLRSTTRLITGAAIIMVVVFGAFASGTTLTNQQLGFGLAVAILLDATLIRAILVPASMEVLGKRNWYLPSWLEWLPHLEIEGGADEEPAKMEPSAE